MALGLKRSSKIFEWKNLKETFGCPGNIFEENIFVDPEKIQRTPLFISNQFFVPPSAGNRSLNVELFLSEN